MLMQLKGRRLVLLAGFIVVLFLLIFSQSTVPESLNWVSCFVGVTSKFFVLLIDVASP